MRAFHARDWGSNPHSSILDIEGSLLSLFTDSDPGYSSEIVSFNLLIFKKEDYLRFPADRLTVPRARAPMISTGERPARVGDGTVPVPDTNVAGTSTIWFATTSTVVDQSL
jgi:hypothetical protein